MNFEDRIRNHLNDQANEITFIPEDTEAVASRHEKRTRNRMITSAAAMVMVAVAGLGMWQFASQTEPVPTAVTSGQEDGIGSEFSRDESASESLDEDAGSDQNTTQDTGQNTTGSVYTGEVRVVSTEDPDAPSNPYDSKTDGSVYYVLSTAPGELLEDGSVFSYPRPNTLYAFTEADGWSNVDVTDRWISDFTPADGVLYAVSTGRTDGSIAPAVGTSADGGQSWSWTDIDLANADLATDEYGFSPEKLRVLPVGESVFLLAQNAGFPDWNAGVDLARSGGLDVSHQEVMNIDSDGITINASHVDHPLQPCRDIEGEYYSEQSRLYDERFGVDGGAFDETVDYEQVDREIAALMEQRAPEFEAQLIAAGCENTIACQRIETEFWRIGDELYRSIQGPQEPTDPAIWMAIEDQVQQLRKEQGPRFEAALIEADCQNTIECERLAHEARLTFRDEDLAMQQRSHDWQNLTPQEQAQLEADQNELWDRMQRTIASAMEGTGCWDDAETIELDSMYDEPTPEFHSWAELGVEAPGNWSATIRYFEVANGQAIEQANPFGTDQIIVNTTITGDTAEIMTIDSRVYFGSASPLDEQPPQGWTWTSTDGRQWSSTEGGSGFPSGLTPGGEAVYGDVALRLSWGEPEAMPALPPNPVPEGAEVMFDEGVGLPYYFDDAGVRVDILPPVLSPPTGTLERSVAGGPWAEVDLASIFGDQAANAWTQSAFSSPIGLFVVIQSNDSGISQTSYIGHSIDGQQWTVRDAAASWVQPLTGEDSVLFIGSRFVDEGPPVTTTTLFTRAD